MRTPGRLVCRQPKPPQESNRRGLSMVEMTATVLVMSIMVAVAVPGWSKYQSEMRSTSAVMALSSDVQALKRHAMRTGKSITMTIVVGTSHMTVDPPVPTLIGDTSGVVDYSVRYPGVVFQSAVFDGSDSAMFTMHGDMVSPSTGQNINNGNATMGTGSGPGVNVNLMNGVNLGVSL